MISREAAEHEIAQAMKRARLKELARIRTAVRRLDSRHLSMLAAVVEAFTRTVENEAFSRRLEKS